MTEQEIKYLKTTLSAGLTVWWKDSTKVQEHCYWRAERVSIGGDILIMEGGRNVPLAHVSKNEFIVTCGDLANWP